MNETDLLLGFSASWWEAGGAVLGAVGALVAVGFSLLTASRARHDTRVARDKAETVEARLREEQASVDRQRETERLAGLQAIYISVASEWEIESRGSTTHFSWSIRSDAPLDCREAVLRVRDELEGKYVEVGKIDTIPHNWVINGPGFGIYRGQQNAKYPAVELEFVDASLNRWLYKADRSLELLNPRTITTATERTP